MGYSKSIRALRRVQPHLELLARSEKNIEIPSDDPTKLSRWIFEGINYCKAKLDDPTTSDDLKLELKKYASLRSKYIIKIKKSTVYCELRDGPTFLPANTREAIGHTFMQANAISSSLEVIGFMIEHNGNDIQFPDYYDWDDLESVYNFASSKGYYLISQRESKQGIMVTQDIKYEGLAWHP